MLPPTHSLQFRVHTRVLVTLLLVLAVVTVAALGEPRHRTLLAEATAAGHAGDVTAAVAKLEAARGLRPDYPRVRLGLARGYAALGRPADALAELRVLAAMGLAFDPAADPALAPLREADGFAGLIAAFAANTRPSPASLPHAPWTVANVTGILESIALDPVTHETYFGDVRNRCVWRRQGAHGGLRKFSAEADALDAVFAVKLDPARRTLWASSSAVPEMSGYTEADRGRAFLVAYDLGTGQLRRRHAVPSDGRAHVLGDFVIAADGTIYATDSAAPVIWRKSPAADRLEAWLSHDDFVSLQGIALAADGRTLHVADYANGIWRIPTDSRAPVLLRAPAGATLFGVDGIYSAPGGLVAVQNGVQPQRVLRLDLAADGTVARVRVLVSAHPAMTDAALGQVVDGQLQFVADSGWSLFAERGATPAPRTVTVLTTGID